MALGGAIALVLATVTPAVAAVIAHVDGGDTLTAAFSVGPGDFDNATLAADPDISIVGSLATDVAVTLTGAIASPTDIDWYAITLPYSTSLSLADVDSTGTNLALSLFDPTGTLVAYNNDAGDVDNSSVDPALGVAPLFVPGVWYLAVSNVLHQPDFSGCFDDALLSHPDFTSPGGTFGGCAAVSGAFGLAPPLWSGGSYELHITAAEIPEPATGAILALGLVGIASSRRRGRRRAATH